MNQIKKELLLKTKKKLFLNISGHHNSVLSGNGLDFKEVREYNTGDDIRHVNWKVTARNLTPSVNIFDEDKQLNIVICYLNSGSLFFGSNKSKQDVAVEVLTTLGFSTIYKNDTLTTIFFSEDEDKFLKPTKSKAIVDINFDTAYSQNPLGKEINYDKLNNYLLNKIKKKSLIFLIGDFLDFTNFSQLGNKHEVYCAVIRDKLEEELELIGEFDMCDTNSGLSQNITLTPSNIKKYNSLMKAYDTKLFTHLKKAKIKYQKIYTADNIMQKLDKLIKN